MELFERVKEISTQLAGSQAALGEALNVSGRTFQGYLTKNREHNLWPLLPKIKILYPQIRREWLWFGEGQMLQRAGTTSQIVESENLADNQSELNKVKEKLFELYEANRILHEENRELRMRLGRYIQEETLKAGKGKAKKSDATHVSGAGSAALTSHDRTE